MRLQVSEQAAALHQTRTEVSSAPRGAFWSARNKVTKFFLKQSSSIGNWGDTVYAGPMKTLEVQVENDGVLRLPVGVSLGPNARLAVLVLDPEETGATMVSHIAQASGAFDMLNEEPELYRDEDILPGRKNPQFGNQPPHV